MVLNRYGARGIVKASDEGPSAPGLDFAASVGVLETFMNARDRDNDSIDGRLERAKDAALGPHDSDPSIGDEIGEAAGGISGVLLGAGIGSAAGPIGTLIGGIAGAIGGWWAGRAVAEAAGSLTHDDDAYYREHFDAQSSRPADRAFDDVRGAYYLGQIASHNPNFTAREFDEVEPELERGWGSYADKYGSWSTVRHYAREGYTRGRSRLDDAAHRAQAEQEGRTLTEREDRRA
jgi:hypothetical protein